jgi:16S rRNA (cytosine967-C5)-methyltransferase
VADALARDARAVALEALVRIEDGAYANLVLDGILTRSVLSEQDRRFCTELVYGATRMRRACDWSADRFIARPPDTATRCALRLGVYQLAFLGTPPHAAVSATVAVAPTHSKGMVNAVLRRVASAPVSEWPDRATELSYPDWIVSLLDADLGPDGDGALRAMNVNPSVTRRDDGYVQDLASQWVVASVLGLVPDGASVFDMCAAPGGKATGLAAGGLSVVAGDVLGVRAAMVAGNATALGSAVHVVHASGSAPCFRPGVFDCVLVDAPCSGLGVLRRRPDARWRRTRSDIDDLVVLQRALLAAAVGLIRPGGWLVYSVCTMTALETVDQDAWLAASYPRLAPVESRPPPWRPSGRGSLLLPQDADTDGMFLLPLRVGS